MPASDLVNLSGLLDDAKCFALVRLGCRMGRLGMRAQ